MKRLYTRLALLLIFLVCLILGVLLGMYLGGPPMGSDCYFDSDCEWKSTNCCPENAGARWECVNMRTFEPPECPKYVICPQVLSPKPTKGCMCKGGECVVGD